VPEPKNEMVVELGVVLVARGGGIATVPSSVLVSAAPRVELGLGVWGNCGRRL
jgi:hypothetical protein